MNYKIKYNNYKKKILNNNNKILRIQITQLLIKKNYKHKLIIYKNLTLNKMMILISYNTK